MFHFKDMKTNATIGDIFWICFMMMISFLIHSLLLKDLDLTLKYG